MENMNHLLVDDRILWKDGTISVPSDSITDYVHLAESGKLFTDKITPEIAEFNEMSTTPILVKRKIKKLSTEWNIPDDIKSIDLYDHLTNKLLTEFENSEFSNSDMQLRSDRLDFEYNALIDAGHRDLIYAILYVINRFEETGTVWGVGRGSSTSSYLLYIMGAHDIDSVEYDLDFTEFLH